MSSEGNTSRETQDTSGRVLPSHPVELKQSDMDNSRSLSPDTRQLRSEGRDAPSAVYHEQQTGRSHHQTGTGSSYGEGYTSDGIPPPLNMPGDYNTGSTTYSSTSEQPPSSLKESLPASTDHGIADTSNAAGHEPAVPSSPVSPSKSENRGFFSRVLDNFRPGAPSETGSETSSAAAARYLQQAPSMSWGKPTDTADIDVVKEQGIHKADATGLDPATATKLAGLDSAAAYNKHEPAVAAAEVLEETKADSRQDTLSAAGAGQTAPHSPGLKSDVYGSPQASPGHHHAPDSNISSSLRTASFENRPLSGEGWTKYSSPPRNSGSSYEQSQHLSGTAQPGWYGQGAQTGTYADSSNSQGVIGKLASAVGLGGESAPGQQRDQYDSQSAAGTGYGQGTQTGPTCSSQGVVSKLASAVGLSNESAPSQQHQQYDSQPATGSGYGQGYGQGAQAGSTSSNPGVVSKLASAVGLGGETAPNQQHESYDSQATTGTGYGQGYSQGAQTGSGTYGNSSSDGKGAQTDSTAYDSSNQGVGSKLASAAGLGSESASQQREQYDSQPTTGTGYGQGYSQGAKTGSGAYGNSSSYGQGAQIDSTAYGSSNQGIGSRLSAVGLGGASQGTSGQSGTESKFTRTLSNAPPSASWGSAKFQPEPQVTTGQSAQIATTGGSGHTPTATTGNSSYSSAGNSGFASGPTTGTTGERATAAGEPGIVGKVASAVGLGGASQQASVQTGTDSTTTGHGSAAYDRNTGSGVGVGATTAKAKPISSGTGTTAATGGSSFTDAGRHDTPVERSAVGFTDEAAPTTAAQTSKHAPSFGTTAHEHASAPGNVSNAGLDTGTGIGSSGTGTGSGIGSGIGAGSSKGVGSGTGVISGPNASSAVGTGTGIASGSGTGVKSGSGTGIGSGSGTGLGSSTGTGIGSGTGLGAQQSQAAGETQPTSSFGTTAAEHALRRTSGAPLARTSGASTNPAASSKQLPTFSDTATGNARSTSDLPVSTNAPPSSARTTQEAPTTTTAAKTEGTNGTAVPSSGTTTGAAKPSSATTAGGIGSQGKPAVPAQPSKTAQTGKHNGFLACFTCGQKSTVD